MNSGSEQAVIYECLGESLIGIHHSGLESSTVGVVMVVGGPQYRVGSHRQYVTTARALANEGIPTFRFDHRGIGDSTGTSTGFESISDDIRSAIDCFLDLNPNITKVVLWGLCDAASASIIYASGDKRVHGLVLLNPWVHSAETEAKARLKSYYLSRLFNRDLWRKIFTLQFNYKQTISDVMKYTKEIYKGKSRSNSKAGNNSIGEPSFISSMLDGLISFHGRIVIVLSQKDITADEFKELIKSDKQWRKHIRSENVLIKNMEHADHTFSSSVWKEKVGRITLECINAL